MVRIGETKEIPKAKVLSTIRTLVKIDPPKRKQYIEELVEYINSPTSHSVSTRRIIRLLALAGYSLARIIEFFYNAGLIEDPNELRDAITYTYYVETEREKIEMEGIEL